MNITFIRDKEQLEMMLHTEGAVLFVFVEWSVYPLIARPKFTNIAERISSDYADSHIGFHIIDEDAEVAVEWLERSNIEGLPGKYTMGWGAILWFHQGEAVCRTVEPCLSR
jgi:hypothetical protein